MVETFSASSRADTRAQQRALRLGRRDDGGDGEVPCSMEAGKGWLAQDWFPSGGVRHGVKLCLAQCLGSPASGPACSPGLAIFFD